MRSPAAQLWPKNLSIPRRELVGPRKHTQEPLAYSLARKFHFKRGLSTQLLPLGLLQLGLLLPELLLLLVMPRVAPVSVRFLVCLFRCRSANVRNGWGMYLVVRLGSQSVVSTSIEFEAMEYNKIARTSRIGDDMSANFLVLGRALLVVG
eukprot:GHVT01069153.1.p2 GENE.GHVT01069153.1~~GHVT01069153.1.p2  ORF type:complete len:150 (-),score=8.06 GHVT01069153.1:269-718(-)